MADGFLAKSEKPSIFSNLELQQYVNKISGYQPETKDLKNKLHKTIKYYQKVHILKTVNKKDYTIDCIPFAEQPSLIDKPYLVRGLLPQVKSTTKNNFNNLKKIGDDFDFNPATECPFGSVAVLRPSQKSLTSEKAMKKIAPESVGLQYSCYSWEEGYDSKNRLIQLYSDDNQAYFKGPQNQYVSIVSPMDHSMDQFWLLNTNEAAFNAGDKIYSVEFGIIASAYFTISPSTSIFVLSSVDNYGPSTCYNLKCNSFTQFPGTVPLGVPIKNKNVDYIFKVKYMNSGVSESGYYFTLEKIDTKDRKSYSQLLGYYPDFLYPKNVHLSYFHAGAEVYAETPANGTKMYGNYVNPLAGYSGHKHIELKSQNGNLFPYSTSYGPAPYGLIWNFGQEHAA